MSYAVSDRIMDVVKRALPQPALDVFLKAANATSEAGGVHNACMIAGWEAVKAAGWVRPPVGKRWIMRKDSPTASDVHVPVPMGDKKPKKKPYEEAVIANKNERIDIIIRNKTVTDISKWIELPKFETIVKKFKPKSDTLYVRRDLVNADALVKWAKEQGFKTTTPADKIHVTVAYSKKAMNWGDVSAPGADRLTITGGERSVKKMGDKGAVALRFESEALQKRWDEIMKAGASWDFDGYRPHVTITWNLGDTDLAKVKPYEGELVFGPERFEPVNEDWKDNHKEVAVKMKGMAIAKTNEEQRMVYGWASVITEKGQPVVDLQGDVIDADTLTKAVNQFMFDVRKSLAMHERNADGGIDDSLVKGTVIQSFVLTSEIMKSLGVSCDREGWIVGVKVMDDAVWKAIKSGQLAAFSIGGSGDREEM